MSITYNILYSVHITQSFIIYIFYKYKCVSDCEYYLLLSQSSHVNAKNENTRNNIRMWIYNHEVLYCLICVS